MSLVEPEARAGGTDAAAAGRAGAAGRRRRAPGSLEAEILDVLHSSGTELSPGEVRERLADAGRLSYSAVVTTLTRLHAKGVVTRQRRGRGYVYAAVGDPAALVAWRMTRLLDEQADHRPALTHFIAALSPSDEALVRALLAAYPADGPSAADSAADSPSGADGPSSAPDRSSGKDGASAASGASSDEGAAWADRSGHAAPAAQPDGGNDGAGRGRTGPAPPGRGGRQCSTT